MFENCFDLEYNLPYEMKDDNDNYYSDKIDFSFPFLKDNILLQPLFEDRINDNPKIIHWISEEITKPKSSSKECQKIQKKMFDTIKLNKKQGRLSKEEKKSFEGNHNKFEEDNITQKIKTRLLEHIYNYVNYEYEKFWLESKNYHDPKQIKISFPWINSVKLIKRISPKEISNNTKEGNLNWLSLKLKDLLSSNLSSKYTKFNPDYNKKRIKNLYEKKEATKVIDILEKNVKFMYEIYINNIKIDGFETLEDDLIALRKEMEQDKEKDIDQYLNKYEKIAKNFEKIILSKKPRRPKIKKDRK